MMTRKAHRPAKIPRRWFVAGSLLTAGLWITGPRAAPGGVQARRLANRIELWSNYASRTKNLIARYTITRETSLLLEPLVVTGTLVFAAPDRLVMRDDGLGGSTTVIDGETLRIVPNQESLAEGPAIEPTQRVAARWLGQRLVRLFAPGDGTALTEQCRTRVPKGRGFQFDLLPPRGSAIRKAVRSVSVELDPTAGAVVEIVIAEVQGDRVRIQLADHRQNVEERDVESAIGKLRPAP